LFDGQHRKANWTLEEAAGPQAITTDKTSVASRAFEENQVAVDRALAKNLLQHIVSSPASPHRLDRADKESGLGTRGRVAGGIHFGTRFRTVSQLLWSEKHREERSRRAGTTKRPVASPDLLRALHWPRTINEAASDNNQSCPAGRGPKYPWLLDESAMAKQRELLS
jgi:hypothetical protein